MCISADFNGWATEENCLQREQDKWALCVPLPPGTYRYGFVVDGRYWAEDPNALWLETDEFGRNNGVVVVP